MNFQLQTPQYIYDLAGPQDDAAQLALFSQPEIGLHIPKYPIKSQAALFDELRRMDLRFKQQEALFWLLENKNNHILEACLSLQKINPLNQSAQLVWLVDSNFDLERQLKSILKPVLAFAFERLGLHRIEAKLTTQAMKHENALLNTGFTKEGILPKQLEFGGQWIDLALYSLLSSDIG